MTEYPVPNHRFDCADPGDVRHFIGERGDLMARCRSCKRLAVRPVVPSERAAEAPPQRPLAPVEARIPGGPAPARTGAGWPTHKARWRKQRHARALKKETLNHDLLDH